MKKVKRLIAVLLVVSMISGLSLSTSAAVCNNGGCYGWIQIQDYWTPYYYYGVGEAWCSTHINLSVWVEIWDGGTLITQAAKSGTPTVRAVTNTIYGLSNGRSVAYGADCNY